jgi:hypothetical protein
MWVFERASGSNYEYKHWDGSSWISSWTSLGGNFAHYPVPVSRGPGLIDLFGIGHDGKIYLRRFNGSTWEASWTNLARADARNPSGALPRTPRGAVSPATPTKG